MARQDWVPVSAERARRHPLYGLGGWLRPISLLITLGAIAGPLVALIFAVSLPGLPAAVRPAGLVLLGQLGLGAAIAVGLALLWFRQSPLFLRAYLELSALSIALDIAAELLLRRWGPLPPPFGGEPSNILAETALSLLLTALPWWLLWRSRRFRVSFQHEMRRDDPLLFAR